MSMNMDAAIRIKANVQGGNAIQAFNRNLKGLDSAAKLSGAELGRMNIAINRMAREAGNTTAGLRQHLAALQQLRDRVEIGGKAYNRLGGEIDALRGKLKALDKDAEKTGGTLKEKLIGGLAAAGVGRLAGGITQRASNFDAELRKAAAIEGGGNFEALRKDIERVAATAAGTPTEVAKLTVALSRAGFTAKETGQALEALVMGAEATDVAYEEMGSIVSDTMRSMAIDTSKTTAVVDIFTRTANSSNQTILDLGESMKYAAPTARGLGININDLAATLGILANNGIRGSEAGTALRSGLERLQLAASGSNDELMGLTRGNALLSNALRTLGAEVTDAQGNLKPMDEVLISLKKNLQNLSTGQQSEILKALFGVEAGGKIRALLNSTEADIRKMFETVRNSAGATKETREAMRGFSDSMKVLGGNIENVSNSIGDKFIFVLRPLVDGLSAAIGFTQGLPQPLKDVAAAAAAAGIATLGLVLALKGLGALGITALITGLAGKLGTLAVAAGTGGAAGAFGALKVAILAIPGWGWAIAGIAALGALGKAVYDNNETFRAWIQNIGGVVANDFKAAMKGMAEDAREAMSDSASYFEGFGKFTESVGNFVRDFMKQVFGSSADEAEKAAVRSENGWAKAWEAIVSNATAAFTGLRDMIARFWNSLPEPIRKFMSDQAGGTGAGLALNAGNYIASASQRAVAQGASDPAGSAGNKSNVIERAPIFSGMGAIPGSGGSGSGRGGRSGADRAAAEAKRAVDQYNGAVKTGTDLTRRLAERLQDASLNMAGLGANATDALGAQRLKAELAAAREYAEEQRKIADLEEKRREAAAKGLATQDLDLRIQAAKELAEQLREVRSVEAFENYTQGLTDLLPKEEDFSSQLRENAILLQNKKKGIEGLTEVQKLNLEIELLDLEAKAEGNLVLKERITRLRELAEALDQSNKGLKDAEKSFSESFGDKIKKYAEGIKDIGGALGDVVVKAFQGMEDKLTEFVTTGKANFKELARSILEDLARIAIRMAIIQPLVGGFGGLFGFAGGGIMSKEGPMPLKKYARGGVASSPQLAMFGEGSTPEAYVPLPDGRRIPVALQGGGGGTSVTVSVDARGTKVEGDNNKGEQFGRLIAQAIQNEIIRQRRPGGLLVA